MMPPNAEVSSQENAFSYASNKVFPDATPQGFACLTITQDGFSKFETHSIAASVSAMLL